MKVKVDQRLSSHLLPFNLGSNLVQVPPDEHILYSNDWEGRVINKENGFVEPKPIEKQKEIYKILGKVLIFITFSKHWN